MYTKQNTNSNTNTSTYHTNIYKIQNTRKYMYKYKYFHRYDIESFQEMVFVDNKNILKDIISLSSIHIWCNITSPSASCQTETKPKVLPVERQQIVVFVETPSCQTCQTNIPDCHSRLACVPGQHTSCQTNIPDCQVTITGSPRC